MDLPQSLCTSHRRARGTLLLPADLYSDGERDVCPASSPVGKIGSMRPKIPHMTKPPTKAPPRHNPITYSLKSAPPRWPNCHSTMDAIIPPPKNETNATK